MRQKLSVLATLAAALAAVGAPAGAETAAPLVLSPAAEAADDGALRYYAQQGQADRVARELKRLEAEHPGYKLPDDLYKPAADRGSPEDQPLWDLFGANKLEELHVALSARKADDPGWEPPADLLRKIKHKEARTRALTLWGAQDWKKLVQLAKADLDLADDEDVELMWTLAEGFAKSKQTVEAISIYTRLLESNGKSPERLATLQKAMANLRMADVETLYDLGRKGEGGANEFDVIKIDLTRARISAFLHDERKDNIVAADLQLFADFAKKAEDPNQPGLLAWYRYKRQEFSDALDWFKQALERGGDAKVAHGLAHSLRQLRQFREAEEVSFAWREYDISNSLLFIDLLEMDLTKEIPPYIEDERLARYGKVSAEQASGEGAQAMAWYAYNSCQYHTALEWFERANAWLPKEATAYGLALTYRRLGERRKFVDTVNRYDGLFPKVVALIFPDDRHLPPTPCEETVLAPQLPPDATREPVFPATLKRNSASGAPENAVPQPGTGGIAFVQAPAPAVPAEGSDAALPDPTTDPTVAYPPGMAPDYPGSIHDPLRRYSWGRVPSPTGAPYEVNDPNYCGDPWQPATFNPREFPLAIDPQNPLRFLATGLPTAQPIPAAALPPAAASANAREPQPPQWPLLARKVPGVLPMPYEHNGFRLQYVSVPDPLHRGVMVQSVRFVAPEQIGGFLTKPWTPQPPPRLGKPKVLRGPQATTLGQCAGRAQARFQAPPFVATPYQATVPALPPQPGAPPVALPQLRSSLPLLSASPIAWQSIGGDVTGSISSQHARWDAAELRKSHGVQVAQAQLRNPNLPAPLGAWQQQPPAPPQAPLIAPQGYNAILNPVQPAPAYQQPAYAPQPAQVYRQAPVYPAAYPAQPGYEPANPAPAAPPQRRARHRQAHAAPHRRVQAAAPSRGGGCAGGRSAAASLSLGWCLMQLDRPQEAAQAFDAAMANGTGKTRDDAAYGKSLASLRANMVNPAVEAANAVALSPKRRNEIGIAVLAQRAVASYNNGGYGETLATLDQRRSFTPETRDLTVMRAWSLYHLGQIDEARRLFTALDQQTSTKESRQGLGAIDSKTPGRRD